MLRPYQDRAVAEVSRAWADGAQRVCLVMPTGAGKTTTARALAGSQRALWLVHRRELADQAPGEAVTVQALLASGRRPECDILVADECHHLAPGAEQWHQVARDYPRILGLTATPQRHDGSALGDLFDRLVVGARYTELVAGGWLVRPKVMRPPEEVQGLAVDPAAAWLKHAGERRGFAYFSRVEQARRFADGIGGGDLFTLRRAATIWGDMDPAERALALARFRHGELRVLSNVQVLTEGVDVPEAEVCMVARGCQHAGSWLQMVGRVMRPAPGKAGALVIDLPGASHRHGLPGDDVVYSLEGRAIRPKVEPLRVCQQCGFCYPSADGACPDCGFAPPVVPPRVRVWDLPLEEALAQAQSPKERGIAKWRLRWSTASEAECRVEYQRLVQIGREKGYKPGWAKYQYKLRTGRWPRVSA